MLFNYGTYTGQLLDTLDVIRPTFAIQCDLTTFNNINYCKIEELNRFYYIESKVLLLNDLVQLNLHIDTNNSFIDLIRNNIIVNVERTSSNKYFNPYMQDSLLAVSNEQDNEIVYIPLTYNPFTDYNTTAQTFNAVMNFI